MINRFPTACWTVTSSVHIFITLPNFTWAISYLVVIHNVALAIPSSCHI